MLGRIDGENKWVDISTATFVTLYSV